VHSVIDAKKLLDILLGAAAQIGQPAKPSPGQAPAAAAGASGGNNAAPAGSLGLPPKVNETVHQVTGQSPDQLLRKAKDVVERNPGLAQAAAIGLAGLLFGARKRGRGLPGRLARLGGLALIGGLAYKALQNSRAGHALIEGTPAAAGDQGGAPAGQVSASGAAPGATTGQASIGGSEAARNAAHPPGPSASPSALDIPKGSSFHPVAQTEDDALLYLRTMVAAAACDGHIDEAERSRITRGLTEAGIDPETTRWLEREMASPADVEELAAGVTNPDKAAQVYAAASIAIDPDNMQEREFLRQLREALDLDQAVQAQIDSTAAALKLDTPT
jgi:uncharacterized membrane protein YebE (DUF533 family)